VSYAAFTRCAKSPDRRCVGDRCLLPYRCSSVGQWWSAARIRACVRACMLACVRACVRACVLRSVSYHSSGKFSSLARSCKVRVNARFEERLFLRERESDTQVTERNASTPCVGTLCDNDSAEAQSHRLWYTEKREKVRD